VSTDRIKALTQYYKDDPSDPFNSYALALEYMTIDPKEATVWFDLLLEKHAEYLPTYYQAARCYDLCHQKEMAEKILEKGITLASKLGQVKTQNELRSFLDELTFS